MSKEEVDEYRGDPKWGRLLAHIDSLQTKLETSEFYLTEKVHALQSELDSLKSRLPYLEAVFKEAQESASLYVDADKRLVQAVKAAEAAMKEKA